MRRGFWNWGVLVLCGGLIVGALALLTEALLRMERERVETEVRADRGERTRLALTQMDGVAYGLLIAENQIPEEHFDAISADGRLSSLIAGGSEFVRLYFEIDGQGRLRSPQVPGPDERLRALALGVNDETLVAAAGELEVLKESLSKDYGGVAGYSMLCVEVEELKDWNAILQEQKSDWAVTPKNRQDSAYQENYSNIARTKRGEVLDQNVFNAVGNRLQSPTLEEEAEVGLFAPIWLQDELFLVREVTTSAGVRRQGIWLREEALRKSLLASVVEWLPKAELQAVASVQELAPLALVSLPWVLEVNEPFFPPSLSWSPLRFSLLIGWLAVGLALLAAAGLVCGMMRLSERRADFVSSVTHELRTPLTTFRLYSGMMVDGMVQGEEKKGQYLTTMRDEAERLHHLVENVLAYSRLERGGPGVRKEKTTLGEVIARCEERLRSRVEVEQGELLIEIADADFAIETDVNGIEQILFNLVDNACKYGMPENGVGQVRIEARVENGRAVVRVCDRGTGIRFSERRRLFRPFHKTAQAAAISKPGVGLGLSLCRRLARTLGGELKLERAKEGACFCLRVG